MKKEKMNLNALKVQSFVTNDVKKSNLKGGFTDGPYCEPTDPDPCGTTGCTNWSDCQCPSQYGTCNQNTCAYTCGGAQSFDISGPCAC